MAHAKQQETEEVLMKTRFILAAAAALTLTTQVWAVQIIEPVALMPANYEIKPADTPDLIVAVGKRKDIQLATADDSYVSGGEGGIHLVSYMADEGKGDVLATYESKGLAAKYWGGAQASLPSITRVKGEKTTLVYIAKMIEKAIFITGSS